jgi:heme/copper-type cytochrome/quinol oxidase subunit 1
MYPILKIALRLEDMFILVAACIVFLGIAYLVDRVRNELRNENFHAANYSAWQMPELAMFVAAVIMGSWAFLSSSSYTIDVQYHDTYLVIALLHIQLLVMGCFLLMSLVYFLARQLPLLKVLTILHLVLTFGVCFVVGFNAVFVGGVPRSYTRGVDPEVSDAMSALMYFGWLIAPAVFVFLCAQLLLLLNILIGLYRIRAR